MKNKMAASRQTNPSAQVKEIRKEYCDTLDSLTFNSKPIIDTLSEIARDYARSIPQIGPPTVVKVIEERIMREKNPRVKLPTLYLMDSIIKNHGEAYKSLFMKNLVETFAAVFRVSKEDERAKMYKLRQTWTPNMPSEILYNLDVKIKEIDPAWPILAKPVSSNNIHINPKRLQSLASTDESGDNDSGETEIDRQIRELKRKKQQLELERMRQEVAQLEDSLHPFDTGASDPKVERPSTSSKKSTTTSVQEKKSENKDPRKNKKTIYVNESKKDQLPENLVKMLDIKPEPKIEILENRNSVKLVVPETDAKNRSKSRSPARRQSPTSTSSEVSSAVSVPPPPPPNIRKANEYEDIKKSRKNQKSRETSSSSDQQLPGSSSSSKKSRESKKRSPSPEKQKNFKIPKKQKTRETSSPNKHHEQKRPSPFKDVQDHRPSQNNRRGSQEPDNGPRDAGGHPIRPTSGPQRPLNEADHPDDIIRDEDMDTGNRHSGRNFRGNNRGGPRSNMDPRNQRQGPGPWQGNRGPPLDPLGPNAPRSIADLQPPGPDGPGPRNFHPRFREQHPIRPSPWMNGPPNGPGPGGPGGPGYGGPQFPHPMGPGPNDGPWNNGPPPGGPHGRFDGPPPRGGGGHFNPNMNQFNGPDPWMNGPPNGPGPGGPGGPGYGGPPRHPLRPDFIPPQGPPGGPPWMNHENFREISPFHNSNSNSNEPMPNHFDNPESNQENQNLNPNVISMDDDPRFQKVMDNNSQSEFMKQETEQQPEPEIAKPEVSKVLDVHQLLQNLVNKGMVSAGTKGTIPGLEVPANPEPVKEEPKEPEVDSVPEITKTEKSASPEKVTLNWEASMKKTKAITPVILVSHDLSIKTRQQGIVEQIFDPDAMQCTNCGVRYSPNEAIAYQKHKDWHFRMNKHKQVLHKRAQSRRWYLGQSDWIISHEIEDNVADLLDEANENENADELIPTVPKDDNPANNRCPVCKEDFIEFYKDENPDDEDDDGGRYHLQNAVRPQGPGTKAYHPQCLVDANKHGVDESFERFESMEEDPNDEYVIGEVATNRLIVTPTDETKIKEETPDADQDVEMKEEEVNATETTAAIPETDVEVKAEIDDSASLATSNVEDQGTTEAVIKKEVPESEADVEVKNEPETDVEVKNEDIDMQDLKEVEDEEKDFPSSNTSLMNLTADAGVTTAFSYPVASDIKINITSQSSAPGSPNPNDDQNQLKVEEPEVKEPETEFDPDAIIQEACNEDIEDPFRHKPKLRGRKLTELPATDKGKDYSSLCSIM